MRDSYYFSHDVDAHTDIKIQALLYDYGAEGYGVYWVIIEVMRSSDELRLPMTEGIYKAIAAMAHCSRSFDMAAYIASCIDLGLFSSDGDTFWSDSLIRRTDKVREISRKRSEAVATRRRPARQPAPDSDAESAQQNVSFVEQFAQNGLQNSSFVEQSSADAAQPKDNDVPQKPATRRNSRRSGLQNSTNASQNAPIALQNSTNAPQDSENGLQNSSFVTPKDKKEEVVEEDIIRVRAREGEAGAQLGAAQPRDAQPPVITPEDNTIDLGWARVLSEYETNIGEIHYGGYDVQRLESYVDDLGAEVVCEGIKLTALTADKAPRAYLAATLDKWVKAGVHSMRDLEALGLTEQQRREARQSRASPRVAQIRPNTDPYKDLPVRM